MSHLADIRNATVRLVAIIWLAFTLQGPLYAQVESAVQIFNRGQLWQSIFNGKIGPNFNNWGKRGIGLDWPGFDETLVQQNVGGSPSYLVTGGFYVGCKKDDVPGNDSVLAVEDWSMYGGTVSNELGSKYVITRHIQKFKSGSNWWLVTSPQEGEEVVETVWEYNINYPNDQDRRYQMPVRVRRTAHQWSGSRRDENYILYEYVITNISAEIKAQDPTLPVPDTLYDFYAMANYALQTNSRSWAIIFPTLTPGARNSWFFYDPTRRMIWGRAGDFLDTPANEEYAYSSTQGPLVNGQPTGEWLSPGFVGVRLLYSSPDQTGQVTRVAGYGWSGASNSIDLSGPFTNIGTLEAKYAVVSDPRNATNFVSSPGDTVFMRRSRMWSMMSMGPWDIPPGDSIVIAMAEIVDGVDYSVAVDPNSQSVNIAQGKPIFDRTTDKAKATYDQRLAGRGLNHPDPPAAPRFTLDFFRDQPGFAGTVVSWDNSAESLPDPDDGTFDLAGYRVYRSSYLPIGPWQQIGVVPVGSPPWYDAAGSRYSFVDSTGDVGVSYYYALTAYDTGKASWPVDPSARFPETGSNRVPSLESSIFANRTTAPFKMTLPALPVGAALDEVKVVPNPFVIGKGFSQPSVGDEILFVNVPNPCTIRIYTVRGDLVKRLDVPENFGGIVAWDQSTDYGQFAKSGIYVYHIDSPVGTKIGKLAIIR